MKSTFRPGAALALLAVAMAVRQAHAQGVEEAVRHADSAWAVAAESNDVDRMLAFYDEDATFIGTTPITAGREQLRVLWSRFFGMPGYKLTWKLARVEVSQSGDLAYTYGPWQETVLRDGQPRVRTGNYLAVWKKQSDGTWKVLVDKP